MKLVKNSPKRHQMLWEKEKSLVISNFTSSNRVFSRIVLQTCKNMALFGKGFPHNDTFWRPWVTSLLKKLWEKEKLLVTSNFSFTHSVFYPFRELSGIFIKFKIVVCRPFQFGPVSNLSSGNGLIYALYHTILSFKDPEQRVFFLKHCGNRRKFW